MIQAVILKYVVSVNVGIVTGEGALKSLFS